MKKILCLFVFCGLAFGELAKHDDNRVATVIAVDVVTGEVRNIKVNPDGFLIITGTVVSNVLLSDEQVAKLRNVWITSGTLTVDNFPADYPDAALLAALLSVYKNISITSGTITALEAITSSSNTAHFLSFQGGEWVLKTGTVTIQNFPVDYPDVAVLAAMIAGLKNVAITSGTVVLGRVDNMISTGVDVSTSSASSVSARSGRRSILVQASVENSGKVFVRESNTGITTNGTELSAGQSWTDENYTGIVYLQASGTGSQNARVQEIYK